MSQIILVRHGMVAAAPEKIFLGCSERPLSERGRHESELLAESFRNKNIQSVYSSPLSRCIDSAAPACEALGIEMQIAPDLREINLGLWEGVPVHIIKEDQPDAYRNRGLHLGSFHTPGGESFEEMGQRAYSFIHQIPTGRDGTVLVYTHAGWIRSLLCTLRGVSHDNVFDFSIPYSSQTILRKAHGTIDIEQIGVRAPCLLDEEELERLYGKYSVPDRVVLHMKKVAAVCRSILNQLPDEEQARFDRDKIVKAALVHDLCRALPEHAVQSAKALRREGYLEPAALVEVHHSGDFDPAGPLLEEEILFYADKLVQEDQIVTLEERFEKSRHKCSTWQAVRNHELQYEKTIGIRKKLEREHE